MDCVTLVRQRRQQSLYSRNLDLCVEIQHFSHGTLPYSATTKTCTGDARRRSYLAGAAIVIQTILIAGLLLAARFEVASIRVHEGPIPSMGVSTSGRRLTAEADTLAGLIMYGWELRNYQVIRTPALLALGDTFYDVTASAEGNVVPTKSEFREMLRTLLAERFQLRVHTEKREMPVYALVPAKNGPKLTEAAPDAAGTSRLMVNGRNYGVTNPKAAMADILRAIENSFPDRPVIDRTGLTATYEIKLTYTPDIPSNRKEPDLGDISIFTALQEQLACGWNRRKLWSTCW